MRVPTDLYATSLALLTDLYQLTMAYGYWKLGLHEREAVFHLTFRKNPFGGGYAVAAGLEQAARFLEALEFTEEDVAYLATLTGNDDKPLFEQGFLDYLSTMQWRLDVDGIPEGTAVFPHEPLVRVRGPLLQAQLVETALLTIVNFQTLVASKAARVCAAAEGDGVLEFGLRRAQGIDGGLTASRAAYIGGCTGTSNVLAGRLFGIPIKGTHAHSWVMCFDTEPEAFAAYAEAMPNNCVFLVDTYDTEQGVHNAVEAGRALRARGYEMVGVRLDSGDLCELSKVARRILDAGGFPDAVIVASNDLDEHAIRALKKDGAKIALWGVGTKLSTCYDQPALGGVYKLAAIRDADGTWEDRVKLSEQAIKVSNPGIQQVRRYAEAPLDGRPGPFFADVVYDVREPVNGATVGRDLSDPAREVTPPVGGTYEDLLVPILRAGALVYDLPSLKAIRNRSLAQRQRLRPGTTAFTGAAKYPVGLESSLHDRKVALIEAAREPALALAH